MYTRWLQYGGFSPVMRTHSSKNGALNKEPWVFTSEYTDAIRKAVRQRYEMAPYIYTMARKGYDEGLALCRPIPSAVQEIPARFLGQKDPLEKGKATHSSIFGLPLWLSW